jgi:hypothetical protein
MPNKDMLRGHLPMVERHVERGKVMIAEQQARIARLADMGCDVASANDVLRCLLETQKLHEQHRERLKRELGLI